MSEESGWTFSPYRLDELAEQLSIARKLSAEQLLSMGEASFSIAKQYSADKCAHVIIQSLADLTPTIRRDARRQLRKASPNTLCHWDYAFWMYGATWHRRMEGSVRPPPNWVTR